MSALITRAARAWHGRTSFRMCPGKPGYRNPAKTKGGPR